MAPLGAQKIHTGGLLGSSAQTWSVPVQHGSQDLRGHYQAAGLWLDLHIPSEQTHIKLLAQISELLVADSLHWCCVDSLGLVKLC